MKRSTCRDGHPMIRRWVDGNVFVMGCVGDDCFQSIGQAERDSIELTEGEAQFFNDAASQHQLRKARAILADAAESLGVTEEALRHALANA